MIQLVLSTAAAAAMQTPSVMKNAIVVVRLVMRMGRRGQDSRKALSAVRCQPSADH